MRVPTASPAGGHVDGLSSTRSDREREHRSERRRRQPVVLPHTPAMSRFAPALPVWDGEWLARHAIALSLHDIPNCRFGWQRCAATPGRSSMLPAQVDERPPAWSNLARAGARSPLAPQTRDTGRRAASLKAQTARVAYRLPSGTIVFLPAATHRPRLRHPHSPGLPGSPPRPIRTALSNVHRNSLQ